MKSITRGNYSLLVWKYALNITCSLFINYNGEGPKPLIFEEKEVDGFIEYNLLETSISNRIDVLKTGDTVLLNCPNSNLIVNGTKIPTPVTNATCYRNNSFYLNKVDKAHPLEHIECETYPKPIVSKTNRVCNDNYQELAISILVGNNSVDIINFCFDVILQRTLYAKYLITPFDAPDNIGEGSKIKFKWYQGNIYNLGKMSLDKLYRKFAYRKYINKQLRLPPKSNQYIADGVLSSKIIVRGQLASKTEYFYEEFQSLTFHYVNTAPQWMSFNLGNWKTLGKCVKRFLKMYSADVTVYTGIHGICHLPDNSGNLKPIYLYTDNFDNNLIPVPQIFWKILYDPNVKSGIAFVGVNNPHFFDYDRDVLCTDICKKIPWITWDRKNVTKGYSYCCEVNELKENVNEIPEDLIVDKLMY